MKSGFNPIHLSEWKRLPYFKLYTEMIPTGFNICVDLDVTRIYAYFHERGWKFAIGYRYITMKLINEREYFKIAYKDEKLGYYDYLIPSYVNFHKDDQTTSVMWVDYRELFKDFMQYYLEEEEKYKEVHSIVAKSEMPPENSCMVGVLPWTSFISYSPIPYSAPTQFFPVLQSGKFKKVGGKVFMPFSITVSHAVADGYQVSEYLEQLQTAMNMPEQVFH